jgi:hypothetical protein
VGAAGAGAAQDPSPAQEQSVPSLPLPAQEPPAPSLPLPACMPVAAQKPSVPPSVPSLLLPA